MPVMLGGKEMASAKNEYFCTNCGFAVVVDYLYPQPCPLCGEALGKRKPTPVRRGNNAKCKKGVKEDGRTEKGTFQQEA